MYFCDTRLNWCVFLAWRNVYLTLMSHIRKSSLIFPRTWKCGKPYNVKTRARVSKSFIDATSGLRTPSQELSVGIAIFVTRPYGDDKIRVKSNISSSFLVMPPDTSNPRRMNVSLWEVNVYPVIVAIKLENPDSSSPKTILYMFTMFVHYWNIKLCKSDYHVRIKTCFGRRRSAATI